MNAEVRSLASLLAADLSTWGVGEVGEFYDEETGEYLGDFRENSLLAVWCEVVPRIILAARWPHGAESVAVYWSVMERVEEANDRPLHGRVYTHDEVFGERGVMHLAVVGELWEQRKLVEFVSWALDHLYPRYLAVTGDVHRCQGRAAVLEHQLNLAAAIAA